MEETDHKREKDLQFPHSKKKKKNLMSKYFNRKTVTCNFTAF